MELSNDFRVSAPPAEAWKVLTDVERIAPMLPGAKLEEIEGDEFRGLVKVKVGPITAQYKGKATFEEQNEAEGRVVLKATGRDTRGQGNANATITATLVPDGDGTRVTVVTDLTITGKVAQFGRGVLADVSSKLIGQFVDALEADLKGGGAPAEPESSAPAAASPSPAEASPSPASPSEPAEAAVAAPSEPTAAAEASPAEPAPAATPSATTDQVPEVPKIRRIDSPDPKPVDLLDAAGGSVVKRLLPVIGGLGVVVLIVAIIRSRRK
jgi:carbon monoxide dehydrogenase subunit G